jgi:uncharacterized protein
MVSRSRAPRVIGRKIGKYTNVEHRELSSGGSASTHALIFSSGDEAVSELLRFARDAKIAGAQITGIGAASRIQFAVLDLVEKRYQPIEIQEQVELLSLLGNIALADDGQPALHAHVVVAKRDGTAHGGHLLELHVRPTLELFLTPTARLQRRKLADLPLQTIRLEQSG